MELSAELRARLWPARDWWKRFEELEAMVLAHSDATVRGRWGFELAVLAEYLVPDPARAMRMYQTSWNATQSQPRALQRIRGLSLQLGKLALAAQAAERELEHTGRPECGALAGEAWLDNGDVARALPLLRAAVAALPGHPGARAALAVAEHRWSDPEAEADRLMAGAGSASARDASVSWLHISRMWTREGNGFESDIALREAVARDVSHTYAAVLLERRLRATERWHELAELYQTRAHASASDTARVSMYRHAGATLLRDGERVLGRAFLVKALVVAYERAVQHPPGHLAILKLLADDGRSEADEHGVADLCAWAAGLPLPDDDRMGVSLFAGPRAWEKLNNRAYAARHVVTLRELSPQHDASKGLARSMVEAPGEEDDRWDTREEADDVDSEMEIVQDQAAELRRRQRDALRASQAAKWADDATALLHEVVAPDVARRRALEWARATFGAMSHELERLLDERNEREQREADEWAEKQEAVVAERMASERARRREAEERANAQVWASEELGDVMDALADALMTPDAPATATHRRPQPDREDDDVIELDDASLEILDVPALPERRARPVSLSPVQREGDRIAIHVAPGKQDARAFRARVRVVFANGDSLMATLRDISVSGAFVETGRAVELDERVSLRVDIPGEDAWSVSTYEIPARIARLEGGAGFGAEFLETPPDLASAIDALRTLVR